MTYFHPSSIPSEVVEKSLKEIEEFFTEYENCLTNSEKGRYLTSYGYAFACELKNILVCGKTTNTP